MIDITRNIIGLIYLLNIFISLYGIGEQCNKAATCKDCMRVNDSCSWCLDEFFRKFRCDTKDALKAYNCKTFDETKIEKSVTATVDRRWKNLTYGKIKPSEIKINIPPDRWNTFKKTFTISMEAQRPFLPADVYILLDRSKYMKNYRNAFQKVFPTIADLWKTMNYRFGIATFVNPTNESELCGTVNKTGNGMKNIIDFEDSYNSTSLRALIGQQNFSEFDGKSNAGVNALCQFVSCSKNMKWRSNAQKIVILFTSSGANEEVYSKKPRNMDMNNLNQEFYKSLEGKLKDQNMKTLILSSPKVFQFYKRMMRSFTNIIGIQKEVTIPRDADSTFMEDLLINLPTKLASTFIIKDTSDGSIKTTYSPQYCQHCCDMKNFGTACIGLVDSSVKELNVTIEVNESGFKNHRFEVFLENFGSVPVSLETTDCKCATTKNPEAQFRNCNGRGLYKCSSCECQSGWYGEVCQCKGYYKAAIEACSNNFTGKICSGFGTCACGKCLCYRRKDPAEIINGRFCECNNFLCPRFNGLLCGGRGKCECDNCICDEGYIGDNCGIIKPNDTTKATPIVTEKHTITATPKVKTQDTTAMTSMLPTTRMLSSAPVSTIPPPTVEDDDSGTVAIIVVSIILVIIIVICVVLFYFRMKEVKRRTSKSMSPSTRQYNKFKESVKMNEVTVDGEKKKVKEEEIEVDEKDGNNENEEQQENIEITLTSSLKNDKSKADKKNFHNSEENEKIEGKEFQSKGKEQKVTFSSTTSINMEGKTSQSDIIINENADEKET